MQSHKYLLEWYDEQINFELDAMCQWIQLVIEFKKKFWIENKSLADQNW